MVLHAQRLQKTTILKSNAQLIEKLTFILVVPTVLKNLKPLTKDK